MYKRQEDDLKIDKEQLARGEIYVGILALDLGLIDVLGTLNDAVEEAARMVKIANYQVLDLATVPGMEPPEPPPFLFRGDDSSTPKSDSLHHGVPQPGLYYLLISDAEVIL